MKSYLYKNGFITALIIALIFSFHMQSQESDINNYSMLFNFNSIKQPDNSRLLEVSFIARNKKSKKDKIPVYDAEINFYNLLNEEEILVGSSKTSKEGIAQITLPESQQYLTDNDGIITLSARFDGTDDFEGQEEEISFKNLYLELSLKEIDSVKMVLVKAFTKDSLGVEIPMEESDIIISVGSMLAKMKLVEEVMEEGEFKFKFPNGLPGDVNGNLTVYAFIEDHDEYGNVIKKETIHWGIKSEQIKEQENSLWSEAAPTWMYIVLTIMLVGVWANYVYTIINLFKIKKEGVALESNN